MNRFSVLMIGTALLAGCTTSDEFTPTEPPGAAEAAAIAPTTTAPYLTTQPGDDALQKREPDTCHAIDYVSALGKPAATIQTLGITGPTNVVEWRGLEPQVYNPKRIVFRLDAAGNIYNIDCG